ncbi:MAG: OmpH family outer membrane protein [Flavobacterium sp.]|jgi:outer membrane protein|uniref:OmpH family outer membrane protein n=1 Tax=Flavobacterium sp. TaxID=239 RepID=UPI0022C4928E|nr:OmpH family outer membrane protein [Flavobacterium sp.]MCZ8089312.1 OmpH family outer membrane protein [Flavobacterium sp.]MCZ8330013.1 OmpH family outer membrane protein [Flavobacterium sp.]
MKKTVILFALAISILSCNKTSETKEFKTAYIDTAKLLEESVEAKDIEAKYKDKSKVMGNQLEVEVARWKSDAANFQKNAQANGMAWAQQKGAELQKREQELSYAQEAMLRQLQQESGVELDSVIKAYKNTIKEYGKEKGYDYIYGTGESATVLYAKDSYDVTKDIIKIVNDKYKASAKKEEKIDSKAEDKAEAKK